MSDWSFHVYNQTTRNDHPQYQVVAVRVAAPTGNAVTDTANLQAAIAAATPPRGSPTTVVTPTSPIELQPGTYQINVDQISFRNFNSLNLYGYGKYLTFLSVNGTGTNGIDLNGVAHSHLRDFSINVPGTVTNAINWHWGDYPIGRSCTNVMFDRIDINYTGGGSFITGWAVGTDHTGNTPQVDSGQWNDCYVVGNFASGSTFINGWNIGNLTGGNNYDHQFYNSAGWFCKYGVSCLGSAFTMIGGEPFGNQNDFNIDSFGGPVVIRDLQSQDATRLMVNSIGSNSTSANVTFQNVVWQGSNINADGVLINTNGKVTSLTLIDVAVLGTGGVVPTIANGDPWGAPSQCSVLTLDCCIQAPVASLVTGSAVVATHINYSQVNNVGQSLGATGFWTSGIVSATAGSVLLGVGNPGTTATDGFPKIPASAGPPTGVPTSNAGFVPMYYDTTNHKVWIYDSGWKGVVVS